jgi:hypothetical protein
LLTVLNYLICGWELEVDAFYLHSFEIWLAVTVVFTGAGNLGFTLLEYRLGIRGLKDSLLDTLKWLPFLYVFLSRADIGIYVGSPLLASCRSFFFFGGLSIHLSKALLAHMFSYNIQWGATKKEVERSNFFLEIPKIIKRFRVALVLSFLAIVMIVLFAIEDIMPIAWLIPRTNWSVIFPLALTAACHILYPVRITS